MSSNHQPSPASAQPEAVKLEPQTTGLESSGSKQQAPASTTFSSPTTSQKTSPETSSSAVEAANLSQTTSATEISRASADTSLASTAPEQSSGSTADPATAGAAQHAKASSLAADAAAGPAASSKLKQALEQKQQTKVSSYDIVTPYQAQLQKRVPSAHFMVILLAAVSIIPGLANTAFNPAILEVAHDYQTNEAAVQALSSHYFLGLGLGQLLWGPLTDRFGRRKTLIAASILAVTINFIFINTTTYGQLELARLLQGLIFSCFGLLPTAVLRDTYSARSFVIYNSWVMILFLLAPAFAPLMGGFILITLGWRWIFTTISGIAVISMLLFLARIPETQDPARVQPINPVKILKNYYTILTNPKSALCLLSGGLISVVIFSWTALCTAILVSDYGVAPEHIGYYSIGPVIFTIIANKVNGTLVKKYSPQSIVVWASVIQTVLAVTNLAVAFYFLGPIGLVIAQTVNALFTGFQNGNMISLYLMEYSQMVGTASSLYLSVRTIVPAILIYYIAFLPRYEGKTFLFFDAAAIMTTLVVVLIFDYLYPQYSKKVARIRAKVQKQRLLHRGAIKTVSKPYASKVTKQQAKAVNAAANAATKQAQESTAPVATATGPASEQANAQTSLATTAASMPAVAELEVTPAPLVPDLEDPATLHSSPEPTQAAAEVASAPTSADKQDSLLHDHNLDKVVPTPATPGAPVRATSSNKVPGLFLPDNMVPNAANLVNTANNSSTRASGSAETASTPDSSTKDTNS